MQKKIIIAGAGHGGLSAAALLAKKGFDVTVYEKNSEGKLGHDWLDVFSPNVLEMAKIPFPPAEKVMYKDNMTFYSPNMRTAIKQNVAPDQLELKMERRDIYEMLVDNCIACGVNFVYNCKITAPIVDGERVTGITTDKGDFYGDMVIDAAGLNSPVRRNLPAQCCIEKEVGDNNRLYVYRAFYETAQPLEEEFYHVCLLPEGKIGLAWIGSEKEYIDFFIGRFEPFSLEEARQSAQFFRDTKMPFGKEVKRGGQFVQIPLRHPLSLMVCDGYAAIGDSAFMTVPVTGNGIANSITAGSLLAQTVVRAAFKGFCAADLWQYQYNYYKALGAGTAALACVKGLLTEIAPEELDYVFEKGILTSNEMTFGADTTSIAAIFKLSPLDAARRGKHIAANGELLKKLLPVGAKIAKVTALTASMPKTWNKERVCVWAQRYCRAFR
ncbi:MAG: NAD(P)/FAD-dependent oxidoreductase [Oscillospiraceae bacterium]|nr:NAD(P)/FAD-dependent oxidoreductase [Oscillospiraceae bacterium]